MKEDDPNGVILDVYTVNETDCHQRRIICVTTNMVAAQQIKEEMNNYREIEKRKALVCGDRCRLLGNSKYDIFSSSQEYFKKKVMAKLSARDIEALGISG